MIKGEKMKEDIPTKFWRKYYNSDIIKRNKMLDKILIVRDMRNLSDSKLTNEQFKFTIKNTLMSYFDDLIEFMEYNK